MPPTANADSEGPRRTRPVKPGCAPLGTEPEGEALPDTAGLLPPRRRAAGGEGADGEVGRGSPSLSSPAAWPCRNALVEHSHDVVCLAEPAAGVTYVNPAVTRLLGYQAHELLGHGAHGLIHPNDQAATLAAVGKLMARHGEPLSHEFRFRARCGRWVWLEATASNLLHDPRVRALVFNVRDASARKQAEEALHQSEALLSALIDSTPDYVAAVDPIRFGLLSFNQALADYFREEFGLELVPGLQPEDLFPGSPFAEHWRAIYRRALAEGAFVTEHTVFTGRRTLELHVSPIVDEGRVLSIALFGKDITERKRAEQAIRASEARFRGLVEHAHDAVVLIDAGRHISYVSPSFTRILGYAPEAIVGQRGPDFTHPEDQPVTETTWRLVLSEPGLSVTRRWRVRHARGRWLWVEGTVSNLLDDPSVEAVVVNLRDITDHVVAQDERDRLQAQLAQAQKMESIGRLAGGVAHDFNNLLQVIVANAEVLRLDAVEAGWGSDEMDEILAAAHRAGALTRQLLMFARQQAVNPRVMDLNQAVGEVVKMLGRLVGERITLVWQPSDTPCSVHADPSHIDQVLANLVVNARDAIADHGEIRIATGFEFVAEATTSPHGLVVPGGYAVLSVWDNGCGMERETLARIFEPFFTTKVLGQGTGLGLATVYGVVRQSGGFVTVDSQPGEGSVFRVYLPTCQGQAPDDTAEVSEPRGHGETVLLVDDDVALLRSCREMLEHLGYLVLPAGTAQEAVALAEMHPGRIDLLLTDMMMPDVHGPALTERILELRPAARCLFMTGYADDALAPVTGPLAEVPTLTKPFSAAHLAAAVRGVLGGEGPVAPPPPAER